MLGLANTVCLGLLVLSLAGVAWSVPVVGGYSTTTVNGKEVQDAAKFAVAEIAKGSNSGCTLRLGKVTKADVQTVNGANYKLDLTILQSKCPDPEGPNGPMTCKVTVHVLSSTKHLSQMSCAW